MKDEVMIAPNLEGFDEKAVEIYERKLKKNWSRSTKAK
jgi:hypothetical protein